MSDKMFNIRLVVGIASEHEPNLFGFMQTIFDDVGQANSLTPPNPKSVAELLMCIVRVSSLEGGYDDLETGLYEVSIDARNNGTQSNEKYCLNVIKEIKKIIKVRRA